MSMRRVVCGLLATSALAAGIVLSMGKEASAQQLGQWGLWGEPSDRPSKSNLGGAGLIEGMLPSDKKRSAAGGVSSGGARPVIAPHEPEVVQFQNTFPTGSIIIDTAGRNLYYTLSATTAYLYPVAVGKEGFTWTGVEQVSKVDDWPDWVPPAEMRQRKPGLPLRMTGGVSNPLGARAIYLGSTLYRIHGTNDPSSIGSAASSGCIRMHNADVVHLAELVGPMTTVFVMKHVPTKGIVEPPPGDWQVIRAKAVEAVPEPAPAPQDASSTQDAKDRADDTWFDKPQNATRPASSEY